MSKVKVETLYVPQENYQDAKIALKGEPVNIVPLGKKREIYPGIHVYLINPYEDKVERGTPALTAKEYKISKAVELPTIYMSEEHKRRTESSNI